MPLPWEDMVAWVAFAWVAGRQLTAIDALAPAHWVRGDDGVWRLTDLGFGTWAGPVAHSLRMYVLHPDVESYEYTSWSSLVAGAFQFWAENDRASLETIVALTLMDESP